MARKAEKLAMESLIPNDGCRKQVKTAIAAYQNKLALMQSIHVSIAPELKAKRDAENWFNLNRRMSSQGRIRFSSFSYVGPNADGVRNAFA